MTSGPLNSSTPVAHTYDERNRLKAVAASGAAPALNYTYDSEGTRMSVTKSGQTTTFVVNPVGLSQVLVSASPSIGNTYYVYGLGLLYQVDDTGKTLSYHYDTRGSTVATSGDTGYPVDRFNYSLYGRTVLRTGPNSANLVFLYNGAYGVMTDPNGLLYMRARYCNPYLQRFLNADPIGMAGGANWYAFGGGNPIRNIDPTGLWFVADDTAFAVGGALVGVGSKWVSNYLLGTPNNFLDLVGAGIGGAAGGLVLLDTANPYLAGAASGLVGNLTTQGMKIATGASSSFSVKCLAVDTGLGTIFGLLPGASVAGVTVGKGSAAAVFEQIATKASKGTIDQITRETAIKMANGAGFKYAVAEGSLLSSEYSDVLSEFFGGYDADSTSPAVPSVIKP